MIWGGIIVAAGRGTRFGRPKQFVELAGLPMVAWSIRTFAQMPELAELVVVTEPMWIDAMRDLVTKLEPRITVRVIEGGATRQESALNGLRALSSSVNAVFVHDGARPLVHAEDVRAGMREVRDGRGAVLASPVVDTIKVVDPTKLTVLRTLDRGTLWAAQTPQFAMVRDLERAHAAARKAGVNATDDVALLEHLGLEVAVVAASTENFKVTHPQDVERAEMLLQGRLEHAPAEEEILFVDVFAPDALADAVMQELESRGGKLDGIDRDLPQGVIVRAFISAEALRGFGERFEAFSNGTATFTTRFSHYAGRGEHAARGR